MIWYQWLCLRVIYSFIFVLQQQSASKLLKIEFLLQVALVQCHESNMAPFFKLFPLRTTY